MWRVLFLLAFVASCSTGSERYSMTSSVQWFNDTDTSSNQTTTAINVEGFSYIKLQCNYDVVDDAPVVVMTCYDKENTNSIAAPAASGGYQLQDCSIVSGTCTSSDLSYSKTLAAATDDKWLWIVDVRGLSWVYCTFTYTNGEAEDNFDVNYRLMVAP